MKGAWVLALLLAVSSLAVACDGEESGQGALPKDFPKDFPIYEGAQPIDSGESEFQIMVRFETDAPREQITDFYRETLDQPPWRVLTARDVVFENESFLAFQREDKEILGTVGVVSIKETGKTNFVVTFTFRAIDTPTLPPEETPAAGGR